jgi:poly(beta-D-mannuronate) lyase
MVLACLAQAWAVAPALAADFLATNAAEVTAALTLARPGDTVIMADGVWTDQFIKLVGSGTANRPITLRAQTPGRVILTGSSRLTISGSHLVADGLSFVGGSLPASTPIVLFTGTSGNAQNSTLTNSAFVDYNPADPATRYHWVDVRGQDNVVANNFFKGQNHSGVTLVVTPVIGTPSRTRIEANHFVDRPVGTGNGFETVRLGTSDVQTASAQVLMQGNLFERTNGEIETISNKSSDNVFRNNTLRNVQGTLTLRHGRGATVDNNFFLGENNSQSGGIRVIGPDHVITNNYLADLGTRADGAISIAAGQPNFPETGYEPVSNVQIVHNTIRNVNTALIRMDHEYSTSTGRTVRPANLTIANNLLYSTRQTLIQGTEGAGWTWAGNIASGRTLGISARPGISTADPKLVLDAATGLYRPAADSPAINSAAAGAWFAPASDMDGQSRTSPADIGADERLPAAAINYRPLAGADVGPAWLNRRTIAPDRFAVPVILFEAEAFTQNRDVNGDGARFADIFAVGQSAGAAVRAPNAPVVNLATGPHDTILDYDLAIHDAGTYTLYGLMRGFDTSSDSVFVPATLGAAPTVSKTVSSNSQWQWTQLAQYTIAAGEVNDVLTLQIGRRERNVEIDAFILSPTTLTLAAPTSPSAWAATGSGQASTAANWTGTTPNAAGAAALFGSVIATPATVTLTAATTLGAAEFNSTQPYTLSGASLTVDATSGSGLLYATAGTHTIASPLVLADTTTLRSAATAHLALTGGLTAAGHSIIKLGAGTMALSPAADIGQLAVLEGSLSLTPTASILAVQSLTIATSASLHLGNNDLIVHYTGTSPMELLLDMLRDGRLSADADSGGLATYLAMAEAADLGLVSFGGVAVDDTTIVAKYTYIGDANLDGQVDALDYERVDLAIGNSGVQGVAAGDLNYDGTVDALDYEQIDLNIGNGVGTPLANAVFVPEPAVLWCVGLAFTALRRARQTPAPSRPRPGFAAR